ncbi:MAG TPA: hypothetical protein VIK05_13990 [Ilumatobacteraceae bacterium]
MADANLFPDEAGFTPRPAWQVIEAARRRYLTGELTLPTTPPTRVYLRDGMVYFAERTSDGALPIRLMMEGVITRDQMQRGTVIVNGVEHVGRMFETDPTIDRASVELCTELFTDDVLTSVANTVVKGYELAMYRRHPSGIDRWYPHSIPVASRPESQNGETAKAPSKQKAKTEESAQAQSEPQVRAEVKAQPKPEQTNKLNAPPITQAVPITPPVTTSVPAVPPPPPVTQAVPVTPAPTAQVPKTMPAPTAQIPVTAAAATVDAAVIADEVAEAIKRAFAGMGAGF